MTLAELKSNGTLRKDTARTIAIQLVDRACQRRTGISIHDLPDTVEISEVYDEVESKLDHFIDTDEWNKTEFGELMNDTFSLEQLESMIFG